MVKQRLGFSAAELVRMHVTDVHPPERRDEAISIVGDMLTGNASICSIPLRAKDGTLIPVETKVTNSKWGDTDVLFGISRDITLRKRMETQVQASLKEKELLLKEIHHRVKNNMQVISSLLDLQSDHLNDKQEVELFKDSQARITSMSLIHELLYQSESLSSIDFESYIQQLVYNLQESFETDAGRIAVNIEAKDIFLGIDVATPLGLIINELVSNCFKYAFPDGKTGAISIALHTIDSNTAELIVGDNGIGIPKDLDFRRSDTLGLQLVTNLTEHQLDGNIEIGQNGGTKFRIKFKMKNK